MEVDKKILCNVAFLWVDLKKILFYTLLHIFLLFYFRIIVLIKTVNKRLKTYKAVILTIPVFP